MVVFVGEALVRLVRLLVFRARRIAVRHGDAAGGLTFAGGRDCERLFGGADGRTRGGAENATYHFAGVQKTQTQRQAS